MNSKSVEKLAACASATLLLWVSLTSFSPAVAKNAEGFTESNTERNTIGTLSELNQIEYESISCLPTASAPDADIHGSATKFLRLTVKA